MTPREVVLAFWEAMATNDFYKASELLAVDYQCYWPQSDELIQGRKNFAAINTNYPTNGIWGFAITRIVSEGDQVVTEVDITDGSQNAKAITFHTVANGLISKQLEYWPEEYEAPAWRSRWVTLTGKSNPQEG